MCGLFKSLLIYLTLPPRRAGRAKSRRGRERCQFFSGLLFVQRRKIPSVRAVLAS